MAGPTTQAAGWAVVTGASAGIGAAFARELAREGFDLVLTARRQDRLEALQAELSGGARRVEVVAIDLAEPEGPAALFDALTQRGIEVDTLVNNAGYGIAKPYAESTWREQADFVQVMVTAVAHLTHLALPGMIERGAGRIVNVASLAGLLHGTGGSTLYSASKAFMIKFTESLSLELAGTGVTATAVCPGLTYSEFHDRNGTRAQMRDVPSGMWMDAESVAREGVAAALAGKVVCVTGMANKWIASLVGRLPRPLAHSLFQMQARLEQRAASEVRGSTPPTS